MPSERIPLMGQDIEAEYSEWEEIHCFYNSHNVDSIYHVGKKSGPSCFAIQKIPTFSPTKYDSVFVI